MTAVGYFKKLYRPWLVRCTHRLARGEQLRQSIGEMLENFYGRLEQAVETGDPGWVEPLLDEWVKAYTESEVTLYEFNLLALIGEIYLILVEVSQEILEGEEALKVVQGIAPLFVHLMKCAAKLEVERTIGHVSRRLEQANIAMERLEKSKAGFISVAAHELKTPLTLIEGYSAMLREQLGESGNSAPVRSLLDGIDKGSRRLREIINDIIDILLIDNQMLSLNYQPIWLSHLFRLLQDELEGSVRERNQTLEIQPFDGWEEMIFGDGERLYQAFRNILLNSIKYTPDGGRITVSGRKLPGFYEVLITDTGIGIDPDDQVRIFEKFSILGDVSLHSSGKTKFKGGGAGLGLAITRGIVEAHGGSIWVESSGHDEQRCPGATFHVLLPQRKSPPDERLAKMLAPLINAQEA